MVLLEFHSYILDLTPLYILLSQNSLSATNRWAKVKWNLFPVSGAEERLFGPQDWLKWEFIDPRSWRRERREMDKVWNKSRPSAKCSPNLTAIFGGVTSGVTGTKEMDTSRLCGEKIAD